MLNSTVLEQGSAPQCWQEVGLKQINFCAWLLGAVAPESTRMFKEGLSKFVDNRLIKWVPKRT